MGIIEELSPNLTGKQRRFLRGLGHGLKPVVLVGQNGISENLIENVKIALLSHELIKIKVHDPDAVIDVAKALHEETTAAVVQWLGKTLLLYAPNPDDLKIKLPRK